MVPINVHKYFVIMVPIICGIFRLEIWVPIIYNKPINQTTPIQHYHKKSNQEVSNMCITKKELESKVQELRSLKAMKEELENELKEVEHSIISYMTENDIDTEITATAKITYKPQSRTTLDKEKLADILGDDLKPFEKVSTFNVLRVK